MPIFLNVIGRYNEIVTNIYLILLNNEITDIVGL